MDNIVNKTGHFVVSNGIYELGLSIYSLGVYYYLCGVGEGEFPSLTTIARKCGITETMVERSIEDLISRKLLEKCPGLNETVYAICDPVGVKG